MKLVPLKREDFASEEEFNAALTALRDALERRRVEHICLCDAEMKDWSFQKTVDHLSKHLTKLEVKWNRKRGRKRKP